MHYKKLISLTSSILVALTLTSTITAAGSKRKAPEAPTTVTIATQTDTQPAAKVARLDSPPAPASTLTAPSLAVQPAPASLLQRIRAALASAWGSVSDTAAAPTPKIPKIIDVDDDDDMVPARTPSPEERTEQAWREFIVSGTITGFKLQDVPEHHRKEAPKPADNHTALKACRLNSGPYHVAFGLKNITGSNCFVNCVLQLLTHTAPFMNTFEPLFAGPNPQHPVSNNAVIAGWYWYIREIKNNLVYQQSYLTPTLLVRSILATYFPSHEYEQHDAGELLGHLLETLRAGYPDQLNTVFGYLQHDIRTCNTGHTFPKETREKIVNLQLPSDVAMPSVQALITRLETPEAMTGDNKYACGSCGHLIDATKKITITEPRPVLFMRIVREQYDRATHTNSKLMTPIHLDPIITIAGNNYELAGMGLHRGANLNSGHWTAIVPKITYQPGADTPTRWQFAHNAGGELCFEAANDSTFTHSEAPMIALIGELVRDGKSSSLGDVTLLVYVRK